MPEPETGDSGKQFLEKLAAGTESAAYELDCRYRSRLCALVAREMDRRFRRREDPEDVVQSVCRTFFRRAAKGEFQVENLDCLWALLKKITRRKILKHVAKHRAKGRDIDKEEYADDAQLPGRAPTMQEARLLGDVLEIVLAGLEPPEPEILRLQLYGYTIAEILEIVLGGLDSPYPEILQLRLQGHTETQIATTLGCGREAVRYKLKRLRERLSKMLEENPDR